jgi:hypothetical protein
MFTNVIPHTPSGNHENEKARGVPDGPIETLLPGERLQLGFGCDWGQGTLSEFTFQLPCSSTSTMVQVMALFGDLNVILMVAFVPFWFVKMFAEFSSRDVCLLNISNFLT